jgi:hypothetical protein
VSRFGKYNLARHAWTALSCGLLITTVACGDSVTAETGLSEPLRFHYRIGPDEFQSQFFEGEMPEGDGPSVMGVDRSSDIAIQGQKNLNEYAIRVQDPGFTVATKLKGAGSGYWISRVEQLVLLAVDQVQATVLYDVSPDLAAGTYELEIAGVDEDGNFGPHDVVPLYVNLSAPQGKVVFSLLWDRPVDLDLQMRDPSGTLLDPKSGTNAPKEQVTDGAVAAGYGKLDYDSLAQCVDSGLWQEDIVFAEQPLPGTYSLYANLYDSCGQISTNYILEVRVDGQVTQRLAGQALRATNPRGGYGLGDHIVDVQF